MQNWFEELSEKELSTKKFHEIIVKAFFINKTNENYLNATLIPIVIFMTAIKQTIFINAFNNWDAHYTDNCQPCDS